jgi:hypothetical protein
MTNDTKKPGDNNQQQQPLQVLVENANSRRWMGKMESYEVGSNFDDYMALTNNFFELNQVTDDQMKVRILVNQIGSAASAKIIKAVKPKQFNELSFRELISLCESIFNVQRNTIVEHFKFNERQQQVGESLADFALELQALAEHCKFGEFYDTALRDKFVSGLRNKETKKVLLTLSDSEKFAEIVESAKREELVQSASGRMQVADAGKLVNRVLFDKNGAKGNNRGRSLSRGRGISKRQSHKGSNGRDKTPANRSNVDKSNVQCHRCGKMGHYARECRAPEPAMSRGRYESSTSKNSIGSISAEQSADEDKLLRSDDDDDYMNGFLNAKIGESVENNAIQIIKMKLNGSLIPFEVDTGTRYTVMCRSDFEKFFPKCKLRSCELPLRVVSGEKLRVLGKVLVNFQARGAIKLLELIVLDTTSKFMPLLGREWLNIVCPQWRDAFLVNAVVENEKKMMSEDDLKRFRENMCREIKANFGELFDNDLSKPIKGISVDIRMKENVKGFVHKPYTVPHSLRARVENEIDSNENSGLTRRVEYCEWASPMVAVRKPNGDIRCCLDGSKTINPHIETNHYPIPIIDDLLANKSDANFFTVLDLKGAYTQLCVNEKSQQFLGLNTIKGLYVYQRLPFGIKPAASIFQSAMDKILNGLENVQAYIDDVLMWGKTPQALYATMKLVFARLKEFNVKVNLEKCQFVVEEVKYLGHILCREGIKPNNEKLRAIVKAPTPQNVTQLKSFLGMVMFYSKFLKNLNAILSPMYKLLKKGEKFTWSEDCEKAFVLCKKELCGNHLLAHYDSRKQIVITCDASDDGISGILSHRINGEEKPVFFVSRTLTTTEKNYPILHREALAIVFALEKFYKYIFGHFVEIFTDHKPLLGIFGSKKGEPPVVASRLQRYIMRLSIFDYELKYRKGKDNGNADMLSRLPIEDQQSSEDANEERICMIRSMFESGKLILNIELIRDETNKDEKLRKLKHYLLNGWGDNVDKGMRHFFEKNDVLGIDCGCLMMRDRIIIPEKLKFAVLRLLHTNHMGITRMKVWARQYVYWEGINKDIEKMVQECEICQKLRKDDQKKLLGNWPKPTYPFERVHIDFFKFGGRECLIFVDAFSRWLEIKIMPKIDAKSVLRELEVIFKTFGYAKELVSDNGPPFFSQEFKSKLESWSIKVTNSPPYHPESNGIIERAVSTAKSALRKIIEEFSHEFQLTKALERFLFDYRNTPHTKENITPTQRIFSYTPRNELTNLKLDRQRNVTQNLKYEHCELEKKSQIEVGKSANKVKSFEIGENVLYISRSPGYVVGLKAKIVKKHSQLTYVIDIEGKRRLAHVDQLRKSSLKTIVSIPSLESIRQNANLGLRQEEPKTTPKKTPEKEERRQPTPEVQQRPKRKTKPIQRLNYS